LNFLTTTTTTSAQRMHTLQMFALILILGKLYLILFQCFLLGFIFDLIIFDLVESSKIETKTLGSFHADSYGMDFNKFQESLSLLI
jgi:hypothetical protein